MSTQTTQTTKKHPCIFCRHSRWKKIPQSARNERPVFDYCKQKHKPPKKDTVCKDYTVVNAGTRAAICDSLRRCEADGIR